MHDCVTTRTLAQQRDIRFARGDWPYGVSHAASALLATPNALVLPSSAGEGGIPQPFGIRPFPEPLITPHRNYSFFTDSVIASRTQLNQHGFDPEEAAKWNSAWKNLLLTAFVSDLACAPNEQAAHALLEERFEFICDEIPLDHDQTPDCFTDIAAYNDFVYLVSFGFDSYAYRRFRTEAERAAGIAKELSELEASLSFKLGRKIVTSAKRIVPSALADKLRRASH